MMPQVSQATFMAIIFPSTWINLSRIQVHSRDFHLTAVLAIYLAKWTLVLLAFEVFHPHLRYLCHSELHLIVIFPCAGIQHLNRSFGRERLSTSFLMWDRCSSKCLFCGGLQAALCICRLSSDTKKIEVAQTTFFLHMPFLAASFSISNSHKEITNWHWFITVTQLSSFQVIKDTVHRDPVLKSWCFRPQCLPLPTVQSFCRASTRTFLTISKCGKELGSSSREVQSLKPWRTTMITFSNLPRAHTTTIFLENGVIIPGWDF